MRFRDQSDVHRAFESRHISSEAKSQFDRDLTRLGEERAIRDLNDDLSAATFGRGRLAGRTGDPFKDDPFFNPWMEGGAFRERRRGLPIPPRYPEYESEDYDSDEDD